MEAIVNSYYINNANKLHKMVDRLLVRLKFHDIDNEDFYSLANEVFARVLHSYDGLQDFDGFLYSCLDKKFKTEMTYRTRDKRCVKVDVEKTDEDGNIVVEQEVVPDVRMDAPINDGENVTYGDLIANKCNVEQTVLGEERDGWSVQVKQYFDSLSPLQRKVAILISENNTYDEICEELKITKEHLENSLKRMFSDEKTKCLN